jgi:signal transduction histidine kinase
MSTATMSDTELQRDVLDELKWEPSVNAAHIGVSVKDGVVTLGMTDLVLDTPLTDDQRQCLETVKSAADSLLGIINDLLDFAKIKAGELVLDSADFSMHAALVDTLRVLAPRANAKGLELHWHMQPDLPDALVGDEGTASARPVVRPPGNWIATVGPASR